MSEVIAPSGPISDDFIYALSHAIPEYSFERDESGSLIVAPNHTDGGAKSGEAYYQLRRWQEISRSGGRAFEASSGFRLPTSALRAPDASWISDRRVSELRSEQKRGLLDGLSRRYDRSRFRKRPLENGLRENRPLHRGRSAVCRSHRSAHERHLRTRQSAARTATRRCSDRRGIRESAWNVHRRLDVSTRDQC